eukprot:Nk52_evm1s467 gene=Nk52_evmTU1s467
MGDQQRRKNTKQAPLMVCPGDRLGSCTNLLGGEGVYERDGDLYASLVGYCHVVDHHAKGKRMVMVTRSSSSGIGNYPKASDANGEDNNNEEDFPTIPKIGSIVVGRVKEITSRFAKIDILCIKRKCSSGNNKSTQEEEEEKGSSNGNILFHPLKETFRGVIRLQDVRATLQDKIGLMSECFRPGDIVHAEVISLGDARSYFCSTARNELGVVYAVSLGSGCAMVPVSWCEMACSKTGAVENRKVAKIMG